MTRSWHILPIVFFIAVTARVTARADFSVKVGTFEPSTSTGNQTVSGLGFTPKLVIFLTNGDSSSPRSTNDLVIGMGAMTSSAEFMFSIASRDNLTTTDSVRSTRDDACVGHYDASANAWEWYASYVSFASGQFTLNIDDAPSGTGHDVHYLALGGSDLDASIIKYQTQDSTGSQAWTGAGFQPNAVMLFGSGVNTTQSLPDTNRNHALVSIGWATSASQEGAMATSSVNNAATSEVDRRLVDTATYTSVYQGDTSTLGEADFTSFSSDGFSVNWGVADSLTRHAWAICLAGANVKVGSDTKKASTGTKATTGVGFQPDAIILMSHGNTTFGSSTATVETLGFSDGTTSAAIGWAESDAVSISNSSRRSETDRVLSFVTADEGEAYGEASVSSLDSDGFTLNWAVANSNQDKFLYFAIGEILAPTGSVLIHQQTEF